MTPRLPPRPARGRLSLKSTSPIRPRKHTRGAPTPDFGDENGAYANDGDCDDSAPGPGMTDTTRSTRDIRHEAPIAALRQPRTPALQRHNVTATLSASASGAFDVNRISGATTTQLSNAANATTSGSRRGQTPNALLDADIKHDATDCRVAFHQGGSRCGSNSASPEVRSPTSAFLAAPASQSEPFDLLARWPHLEETMSELVLAAGLMRG